MRKKRHPLMNMRMREEMSIQHVADMTGITVQRIRNFETARSIPGYYDAKALENLFMQPWSFIVEQCIEYSEYVLSHQKKSESIKNAAHSILHKKVGVNC